MQTVSEANILPFALDVIECVLPICPGATIVGGVLRDHFIGIPPQDLDIFVPLGAPLEKIREAIVERFGHPFQRWQSPLWRTIPHYKIGRHKMRDVHLVTFIKDLEKSPVPIQIIELDRPHWLPQDMVLRVDFDICRIGLGRHGLIDLGAINAIRSKVAVYCGDSDPTQVERSKVRARRWAKRFPPEFRFIFPDATYTAADLRQ